MAASFTKIMERVMSSYAAAMTTEPIESTLSKIMATSLSQLKNRVTSSFPAEIKTVFLTEHLEPSVTQITPSLIQLIERIMSSYNAAITSASSTELIEPTLSTIATASLIKVMETVKSSDAVEMTRIEPSVTKKIPRLIELMEDVTSASFDETTTFSSTEETTFSVVEFTPYLPNTVQVPSTVISPSISNLHFSGISVDAVSNVVNLNRTAVAIPVVHLPVVPSTVLISETFFGNQQTVVNSKSISPAGFTRSMNDSSDPCSGFICGSNAQCFTRSFRVVCQCRSGYEGDPYTGCRRSECVGKISTSNLFFLLPFLTTIICCLK